MNIFIFILESYTKWLTRNCFKIKLKCLQSYLVEYSFFNVLCFKSLISCDLHVLQSFVELFLHKLRKSNEAYLSIFIFEVYGTSLCLRIAKITIYCYGNWVKRRREGRKRWKDSLWSLSQIKNRHRSLLIDRTLKD